MILIAGAGIGVLTLGCALADNAFRAPGHLGLDARVRASGEDLAVAAVCAFAGWHAPIAALIASTPPAAVLRAVVMAGASGREPSIEAALSRYQATRVPRANSFVERSRRMGRVAHLRSGPVRWLRDTVRGLVPVRLPRAPWRAISTSASNSPDHQIARSPITLSLPCPGPPH